MKEITIELDILNQMTLDKVCASCEMSQDEAIALAIDHFLSAEGYNNLNASRVH